MLFLMTTLIVKLVVLKWYKGLFMYYIFNKGGNVAKMDIKPKVLGIFVS